jgi:type I restriction enzyme R subunit
VVFVVDRKDLDYQTMQEFNSFKKGSVDVTDNTASLVAQLTDATKLVLTTIQKLNNAITKHHYENKLGHLKDKKIVFIFDECHRSQFGETHDRIINYFKKAQLFGFTGTHICVAPIKAIGQANHEDLFGICLHKCNDHRCYPGSKRFAVWCEYIGNTNKPNTLLILKLKALINLKFF